MFVGNEAYHNVIWLEIRVQNSTILEMFQGNDQLFSIYAHCIYIKPNRFSILLDNFAQVHAIKNQRIVNIMQINLYGYANDSKTRHK